MSGPDRKAIISGLLRLLEGAQDAAIIDVQFSRGGKVVFELPSPPHPGYEPGSCEADILGVLHTLGRRLVTTEILSELAKVGKPWGDTTVKTKLAEMIDVETLNNDAKARPRGYGLPDW